jgi:hypothetical protein
MRGKKKNNGRLYSIDGNSCPFVTIVIVDPICEILLPSPFLRSPVSGWILHVAS